MQIYMYARISIFHISRKALTLIKKALLKANLGGIKENSEDNKDYSLNQIFKPLFAFRSQKNLNDQNLYKSYSKVQYPNNNLYKASECP